MISSFKKTRFTQWLIRENGLDEPGLKEWVFCPGMVFRAECKWWGDKGPRNTPHEGLDIFLYRDRQDRIIRLDEKTRIPVMFDGVVVSIINDFLGSSVMVEHVFSERELGRLCTIYGHTNPLKDIHIGWGLKQGDIMGTLADPGQTGFNLMPHLHISVGWASKPISYDRLNWDTIGSSGALTLLDPLDIINWQYQILDETDSICRDF
jgi:murein DD-endopeptidase MepM/ murein hydrolase activator NlpD